MKQLNIRNIVLYSIGVIIVALICFLITFIFAEKTSDKDHIVPQTDMSEPTTTAVPQTTIDPFNPPTLAQTMPSTSDYNILGDPNIRPLPNPITIKIKEETWFLTLVNNQYRMPADHQVIAAAAIPGSDIELDYRVAEKYTEMYNAAAAEGLYLTPYSGLRSYSRQKINYEYKTNMYLNQGYSQEEALALAAMVIMPPGCSEHNLGLAMDIIDTADNFYTTAEYAWLEQHAADYGFILRYPKDKQAVTQVEYEPWHWRYVGVEYAHAIKNSGMCLEEYLQAINMLPEALAVG